MRIAIVHSFYSSRQPSGENSVVDDQARVLREAGHEVALIARRTDEEERSPLYAVRSAARVSTGRGWSPEDELTSFAPDVVHLHNTFPNIATGWLRDWGGRTVATLHNYRTVCAAGTLFRDGAACRECLSVPVRPALVHKCYRDSLPATLPVALATRPGGALRRVGELAGEVIVLNEQAEQTMSEALGRRVRVVPNFTPTVAKSPTPGIGWAFVGRLSSEKGPLELLRSWPNHERLDLYGDGSLRGALEDLAQDRGLDVRFHGLTPHAALLEGLSVYEGLIVPSMCAEGLPTAVLEGLARGLPAVVSSFVSMGSTLEAAGAGLTVDLPSTPDEMSECLRSLRAMQDAPAAARLLHRELYSPEAWMSRMEPIYQRIADS